MLAYTYIKQGKFELIEKYLQVKNFDNKGGN